MSAMISVVIPTLNAERHLAACLTALVPAAVEGFVREVIVVDGGSTDRTTKIVDQAGADLLTTDPGRGRQLLTGARRARQPWLLFLHADTVLAPDWDLEAAAFMGRVDSGDSPLCAATFRFALEDRGLTPRVLEGLVALRGSVFALPYGDQGLLIPRRLYDEIGGYRDMALMEDVDIVRRLGRRRLRALRTPATTSAERYRQEGYVRRILRNQASLALYVCGASQEMVARVYSGPQAGDTDARGARKAGGRMTTM
ncbi:MAG: TIGR04283 family arsenosugar biosynthesis glycosyltransferase [Hyphomicrobiaceae bacterium]